MEATDEVVSDELVMEDVPSNGNGSVPAEPEVEPEHATHVEVMIDDVTVEDVIVEDDEPETPAVDDGPRPVDPLPDLGPVPDVGDGPDLGDEPDIGEQPDIGEEPVIGDEPEIAPGPELPAMPSITTSTARTTRPSYEPRYTRFGGRRPLTRGYESTRRTGFMVLFVPLFAALVVVAEARVLYDRWRERSRRIHSTNIHFERPPGMPKAEDRSVADVMATLESFPFEPLDMSVHMSFNRQFGPDSITTAFLGQYSSMSPFKYPAQFRPQLVTGADGVKLSAQVGMQPFDAPAIIICHGLLTTKDFDYIRRAAIRAYDWGFHVVTLDQRGWGDSAWTTDTPPSGGYMEGRDVVEVARWLQGLDKVTSVGGWGFSMGASTMLNAARWSSEDPECPLDGGVLAISGPTDIRQAVKHISTRPNWRNPYFMLYTVFGLTVRKSIGYFSSEDRNDVRWSTLVRRRSLPFYNVDEDEFYERASAVNFAQKITVPTLDLHATDDFMVTVDHALRLREAAEGNENVRVWIVDQGNHVSFEAVDQRWYFSVVRRWFEYWAEQPAERAQVG